TRPRRLLLPRCVPVRQSRARTPARGPARLTPRLAAAPHREQVVSAIRYRGPVPAPFLTWRDYWEPVEGFRLISVDGPWLPHPDVTICTFEDDDAPPELEGKLVEPTLTRDGDRIFVSSRQEVIG